MQRELREELAIEVEVGELFTRVDHAFTHFRITLFAFTCRYLSGEPQALGVRAELVGDVFYGAGTVERRVPAYPMLSVAVGLVFVYEVLP